MALMSDRFTSLEDILKIDPMKSYYSEQKLNEDALEYMQVYDRTTNSLLIEIYGNTEIWNCNYKCHKIS